MNEKGWKGSKLKGRRRRKETLQGINLMAKTRGAGGVKKAYKRISGKSLFNVHIMYMNEKDLA